MAVAGTQNGNAAKSAGSPGMLLVYGLAYIGFSAGLISFNKYLIHEGRFPYAVPLVLTHTVVCSCMCLVLYFVAPSLFPSLVGERKITVDYDLVIKGALPIALLFSAQLALSNMALLHTTLAFVQMMKEANITLVYVLSLAVALERFNWPTLRILTLVVFATALTIHGELHFSLYGFAVQGTSQLFESCKIVLQALLLSAAGKKLDALTYVLLVMPLCFIMLSIVLCGLLFFGPAQHGYTPPFSVVMEWMPLLVLNAVVAFCLNVSIALFVKHSSPIAFILAGIVKDAGIVMASGLLMGDPISPMQSAGFILQLFSITAYTLSKTFPDKFEDGFVDGLKWVVLGDNVKAANLADKLEEGKDYGAVSDNCPQAEKVEKAC